MELEKKHTEIQINKQLNKEKNKHQYVNDFITQKSEWKQPDY